MRVNYDAQLFAAASQQPDVVIVEGESNARKMTN